MLGFKDYLFIVAFMLTVAAIVCGLVSLAVYVSYWFIIPTAIFTIVFPWFMWDIVIWWVWR